MKTDDIPTHGGDVVRWPVVSNALMVIHSSYFKQSTSETGHSASGWLA